MEDEYENDTFSIVVSTIKSELQDQSISKLEKLLNSITNAKKCNIILTIGDVCKDETIKKTIEDTFGKVNIEPLSKEEIGHGALQRAVEIKNSIGKDIDICYNIPFEYFSNLNKNKK